MKSIVLAGGCFWGVEKLFSSFPGISRTTVGYANGISEEYANYSAVCSGLTGFREAVLLEYDPEIISLGTILNIYFDIIDPTAYKRQGMDIGSQYQTGIYCQDTLDEPEIKSRALEEKAKYKEFYTELLPLRNFFPAEEYHQKYLEKNPDGYCHISPVKQQMLLDKYSQAEK